MDCLGRGPPHSPDLDFDILAKFPHLQTLTVEIRDSRDFEKIAGLAPMERLNLVAVGYSDENLTHLRASVAYVRSRWADSYFSRVFNILQPCPNCVS